MMRYAVAALTMVGVIGLVALVAVHAEPSPAGKASAARPAGDAYTGEYTGTFTSPCGKSCHVDASVYPRKDDYAVTMRVSPLPAKGGAKIRRVEFAGKVKDGKLLAGNAKWKALIGDKALTAVLSTSKGPGKCALDFNVRKSPTLGAKPPAGAVVLLPFTLGKNESQKPSLAAWANTSWQANKDGSMNRGRGNMVSKHTFGSAKIHVEFMTPYEPHKRGQGRGNSGVYVHGRYEVQVLDSFGLIPGGNDCGAIYGVAAPRSSPPP